MTCLPHGAWNDPKINTPAARKLFSNWDEIHQRFSRVDRLNLTTATFTELQPLVDVDAVEDDDVDEVVDDEVDDEADDVEVDEVFQGTTRDS